MGKIRALFLFCLIGVKLSAAFTSADTIFNATLFNTPSTVINGCVNALTGEHFIHEVDYIAEGYEPIQFVRSYLSSQQKNKQPLWEYFSHLELTRFQWDGNTCIKFHLQNGPLVILAKEPDKLNYRSINLGQFSGYTNMSQLGKNHPVNCRADQSEDETRIFVYLGDGSVHSYKLHKGRYFLTQTKRPNGAYIGYQYDGDRRLTRISSKMPVSADTCAIIDIQHESPKSDGLNFAIFHNGEKVATYYHREKTRMKEHSYLKRLIWPLRDLTPLTESLFHLSSIDFSRKPSEHCSYDQMGPDQPYLLTKRDFSDNRFYFISYNPEQEFKVNQIISPKDRPNDCFVQYKFQYDSDSSTSVFNANGVETRFFYSKDYLLKTIKRNGDDYTEEYRWSTLGDLLSKKIFDESRKCILEYAYEYDDRHNVISEKLIGDLTGRGSHDTYEVKNTYSDDGLNNLKTKTYPNGKKEEYFYLPETDLLVSKLISDGNQIQIRNFWEYDKHHVCIREITDNGKSKNIDDLNFVTKRRVLSVKPRKTGHALYYPDEVTESYFDKDGNHQLSKKRYFYDKHNRVSKAFVFDNQNKLSHTLLYTYDKRGRKIKCTDEIGRITSYEYDNQNNCVAVKSGNQDYRETFQFDCHNREISHTKLPRVGTARTTRQQYNELDQIVAQHDFRQNQTLFQYDAHGYPIEITLPPSPNGSKRQIYRKFNSLGYLIEQTDPDGNTTQRVNNARGDPIKIIHPDHTIERYTYTVNGLEEVHISQSGLETHTTYDFLDRPLTVKKIKNGITLTEETYIYDAFDLLSHQDIGGLQTTYEYDGASRLVSETRGHQKKSYKYDSLGRQSEITHWLSKKQACVQKQELDRAGRVVIESKLDLQGTVKEKRLLIYDKFDNVIKSTKQNFGKPASYRYQYDSFGRELLKTDPMGHETETIYHDFTRHGAQFGLKKIVINAKGIKASYQYDADDNLACEEHPHLTSQYSYSAGGDKIAEEHQSKELNIKRSWSYDSCHRVVEFNDMENTQVSYSYTVDGRLKSKTKADGTTLSYQYNSLGYLSRLISSDHSVHYTFDLDVKGNILSATDHVQDRTFERRYDIYENLISESIFPGFTERKTYDSFNRLTSISLPNLKIQYTYDAHHLVSASLNGSTHFFDDYDMYHNPLNERLCDEAGTISKSFDLMGRQTKCHSPYHTETVEEYDALSNPHRYAIENSHWGEKYSYAFDSHNQLSGDGKSKYKYDGLQNRVEHDGESYKINPLNQIVSIDGKAFTYDLNGNLINSPSYSFKYDALDRITAIKTPNETVKFLYDPFNRRIEKNDLRFIYHDNIEIASLNRKGEYQSYRLITPDNNLRTLLIGINGYDYSALTDVWGNIHGLVYNKHLYLSHAYSPFGEVDTYPHSFFYKVENPYQFKSKRVDIETGCSVFGRRLYNPHLGRWLTPDPLGFHDGPNPYHFLHNNPLQYDDPTGLLPTPLCLWNPKPNEEKLEELNCEKPEWWEYDFSKRLVGVNGHASKNSEILLVGGMATHRREMEQRVFDAAQMLGQRRMFGFRSSDYSTFIDIATTLGSLAMEAQTPQSKDLRRFSKSVLDSNKELKIFAHSKGSVITHAALAKLPKEQQNRISIFTYGAPYPIPKGHFKQVVNFASRNDWIGKSGQNRSRSFFPFKRADTECVILNSQSRNPLKEHRFENETYYNSFSQQLLQFK